MNHQDLSLSELAWMRRLAREVLIDFATRLKHSLTHEQADQLYLEASGLIPLEHPAHRYRCRSCAIEIPCRAK